VISVSEKFNHFKWLATISIEQMSFQLVPKTGFMFNVADLMFWGSWSQTEVAAMTKVWSLIKERLVAGMASKDDAAKRRCSRPGTSATHHMSDDKYLGAFLLMHWNISVTSLKVIRSST